MLLLQDDSAPYQLADPSTKAALTTSLARRSTSRSLTITALLTYTNTSTRARCLAGCSRFYTMCLLYTNRTATNRAIVLRMLHHKRWIFTESPRSTCIMCSCVHEFSGMFENTNKSR
ncbi:hypothetical protein F4824DRAFT_467176 [Ustulina deusta]|nr:hypothetical protein F4824DRAFT_467176 [Ustulina deusta]